MFKFNIKYYISNDLIILNFNIYIKYFYVKFENYNIFIAFIIFNNINIKNFFTRDSRFNNIYI